MSTPPARVAGRPAPAELRRESKEPKSLGNPGESEPAPPPAPAAEPFPVRPARVRPSEPEPVPTTSLARLERGLDAAMQAGERGGMRRFR